MTTFKQLASHPAGATTAYRHNLTNTNKGSVSYFFQSPDLVQDLFRIRLSHLIAMVLFATARIGRHDSWKCSVIVLDAECHRGAIVRERPVVISACAIGFRVDTLDTSQHTLIVEIKSRGWPPEIHRHEPPGAGWLLRCQRAQAIRIRRWPKCLVGYSPSRDHGSTCLRVG
jgi:hypothetical protein